jgi:hypothetical protein
MMSNVAKHISANIPGLLASAAPMRASGMLANLALARAIEFRAPGPDMPDAPVQAGFPYSLNLRDCRVFRNSGGSLLPWRGHHNLTDVPRLLATTNPMTCKHVHFRSA